MNRKSMILILFLIIGLLYAQNKPISLVIKAVGEAKAHPRLKNPARKKLMAIRGAKIIALRNLLLKLQYSLDKDFSPVERKSVQGIIAGYSYGKPTYKDGVATIEVSLPVGNLLRLCYQRDLELSKTQKLLKQNEESLLVEKKHSSEMQKKANVEILNLKRTIKDMKKKQIEFEEEIKRRKEQKNELEKIVLLEREKFAKAKQKFILWEKNFVRSMEKLEQNYKKNIAQKLEVERKKFLGMKKQFETHIFQLKKYMIEKLKNVRKNAKFYVEKSVAAKKKLEEKLLKTEKVLQDLDFSMTQLYTRLKKQRKLIVFLKQKTEEDSQRLLEKEKDLQNIKEKYAICRKKLEKAGQDAEFFNIRYQKAIQALKKSQKRVKADKKKGFAASFKELKDRNVKLIHILTNMNYRLDSIWKKYQILSEKHIYLQKKFSRVNQENIYQKKNLKRAKTHLLNLQKRYNAIWEFHYGKSGRKDPSKKGDKLLQKIRSNQYVIFNELRTIKRMIYEATYQDGEDE